MVVQEQHIPGLGFASGSRRWGCGCGEGEGLRDAAAGFAAELHFDDDAGEGRGRRGRETDEDAFAVLCEAELRGLEAAVLGFFAGEDLGEVLDGEDGGGEIG